MKLLKSEWNGTQRKYYREWLADNESDITADFDSDSAAGSVILAVTSGEVIIKNTEGKWQKFGSSAVIG